MEKIYEPFDKGIKRGRSKEDKTVMEWFAIDYLVIDSDPVIDSDKANLYLPSYKEGFNIGEVDNSAEYSSENHFKVWVNPDALRAEEEAESIKRYKEHLKTL